MTIFQRKSNNAIWRAGNTVLGLCAAYNYTTNPSKYLSEHEMKRSSQYARAIKNRMEKLGIIYGIHYRELSNGALFPNSIKQGF